MSIFYPRKFENNGARVIRPLYNYAHLKDLYIEKKLKLSDTKSHANHLIICNFILEMSMRIRARDNRLPPYPSHFYMQALELLSNAFEEYRPHNFIDDRPQDASYTQSRELIALERLLNLTLSIKDKKWAHEVSYKLCKYNAQLSHAFGQEIVSSIRGQSLENFIFLNELFMSHNISLTAQSRPILIISNPNEIAFSVVRFIGEARPIETLSMWVDASLSYGFKTCEYDYSFSFLDNFSYHLKNKNGEELVELLTQKMSADVLADIFDHEVWSLERLLGRGLDNWDEMSAYIIKNFDKILSAHDAHKFLDSYGINLFTFAIIYSCHNYDENYGEKICFPILAQLQKMGQKLILPEKITVKQGNKILDNKKLSSSQGLSIFENKEINIKNYFYNDLPLETGNYYETVLNYLEKISLEENVPSSSVILELPRPSFKI